MARKITDDDIVEALTGTGTTDRAVVEALRGTSTAAQRAENAVLEALGHTPTAVAAEGELPLQDRGDDLEAVRVWAAQGATEHATKALAEALMRADGSKGIYAAEVEAKAIAGEAYAVAAQTLVYEDDRQKHVLDFVTKTAQRLTRLREASTPKRTPTSTPTNPQATSVTEATKGKQLRTSISGVTGQPFHYYS